MIVQEYKLDFSLFATWREIIGVGKSQGSAPVFIRYRCLARKFRIRHPNGGLKRTMSGLEIAG